ncbi:MAG: hypothetical protein IKX24_03415 [Prevotella sp.]|nr:hypothetical protein [Prevotella sp.]
MAIRKGTLKTGMPSFCPFRVMEAYTLQRDAMLAGTLHYPYTSSIHDLQSV